MNKDLLGRNLWFCLFDKYFFSCLRGKNMGVYGEIECYFLTLP